MESSLRELLSGWLLAPAASTVGPQVDSLYHLTLWMSAVLFVATQAAMVWFVWRYRRRKNPKATYRYGSLRAELAWTVFAAAVVVTLGLFAQDLWSKINVFPKRPDLTVRVLGEQWLWHFQYPGADGEFDTADDVSVQNEAHVPVERTVVFEVRSQDVVHGFYIPALRIHNDALPGLTTRVWAQATREGQFDIRCTQFCGTNHYQMRATLVVDSPAAFDAWQKSAKEAVF
jgi:cytochrome c oxidase subunit II